MRVAEIIFFTVSIVLPLVVSIIALVDGGFGPIHSQGICMVSVWYGWLFAYGCMVTVFLIVVVSLVMLFWFVRTQEKRAARYSTGRAARGRGQKQVLIKGMLYLGAFLVVYIPPTVATFTNSKYENYIISFFLPLQGVLNALIYSDLFRKAFKSYVSSISTETSSWFASNIFSTRAETPGLFSTRGDTSSELQNVAAHHHGKELDVNSKR